MANLYRFFRAPAMSLLMFFSMRQLGVGDQGALIFSLIPLVLGWLNVISNLAYGVTGLMFILACVSYVYPDVFGVIYSSIR